MKTSLLCQWKVLTVCFVCCCFSLNITMGCCCCCCFPNTCYKLCYRTTFLPPMLVAWEIWNPQSTFSQVLLSSAWRYDRCSQPVKLWSLQNTFEIQSFVPPVTFTEWQRIYILVYNSRTVAQRNYSTTILLHNHGNIMLDWFIKSDTFVCLFDHHCNFGRHCAALRKPNSHSTAILILYHL